MNKPIYGISSITQCPTPILTPDLLSSYISRSTSIIATLLTEQNKQMALNRLDVIRQEIAVYTNIPAEPLPAPINSGITTDASGNLTISTNNA